MNLGHPITHCALIVVLGLRSFSAVSHVLQLRPSSIRFAILAQQNPLTSFNPPSSSSTTSDEDHTTFHTPPQTPPPLSQDILDFGHPHPSPERSRLEALILEAFANAPSQYPSEDTRVGPSPPTTSSISSNPYTSPRHTPEPGPAYIGQGTATNPIEFVDNRTPPTLWRQRTSSPPDRRYSPYRRSSPTSFPTEDLPAIIRGYERNFTVIFDYLESILNHIQPARIQRESTAIQTDIHLNPDQDIPDPPRPTAPTARRPRDPQTTRHVQVVTHFIDDLTDTEFNAQTSYPSSVRIYYDRNDKIHRIDIRERIASARPRQRNN